MRRTMRGLGWTEAEMISPLKNDSGKLAMAARVRKETTLPIKWIAPRLQMDTSKSLKLMLFHWRHAHKNANAIARSAQLQFQPPVMTPFPFTRPQSYPPRPALRP